MDRNDYLGSFAQENVTFNTQVIRVTSVGDNYMKTVIFTTDLNLTADGVAGLVTIPGSTYKALTVTGDDFATYTTGLLQSWLVDLYANGSTYDTIIVSLGAGTTKPTTDELTAAYEVIKPYGYHKTIVVGGTDGAAPADNTELDTALIAHLVSLCTADKTLLSSAVLLPYSTFTVPTGTGDDVIYTAVKEQFVFMACHTDKTRNAALYSLGLALSIMNGSGTPIGNPLCRPASSAITQSDASGSNSKTVRDALNALFIQTFKPVGDNSGAVCAEGEKCLNGDVYAAQWLMAYINYMVRVNCARLITGTNTFWKNEASYTLVLEALQRQLSRFGSRGSGRLENINITAPGFASLPESSADELVIPNAWVATFIGVVNKITITGTLYVEV